jgi:hypothetical protein
MRLVNLNRWPSVPTRRSLDARRIDGDCTPTQRDLPRAAPAITNDQGMGVGIAHGDVGV